MQPSEIDWNDVRKHKYGHLSESASQHQEATDILELGLLRRIHELMDVKTS